MLIAVTSRDGREINQHFGHADRFLIFDVVGDEARLVDERKVERYCTGEADHSLRAHVLASIAGALAGCRALVCAQIGQAPQMEMERLGLETFTADGPIKVTLVELAKVL